MAYSMLLATLGFWLDNVPLLMFVLFLLGLQSTIFGPIKYGILPEMLRSRDLPRANGLMLMTTFLAIIFGAAALAATLAERLPEAVDLAGVESGDVRLQGRELLG